MPTSVKIDAALVASARTEAETHSRSLGGQLTHWARIGRAVERSGRLDHVRLSRVLAGEVETAGLTAEEHAVWSERFLTRIAEPGPEEVAEFADMRARGGAVGLDDEGQVVTLEDEAFKDRIETRGVRDGDRDGRAAG